MFNQNEVLKQWLKTAEFYKNEIVKNLKICKGLLFNPREDSLINQIQELKKNIQQIEDYTKPTPPEWIHPIKSKIHSLEMDYKSSGLREQLYTIIKDSIPTIENYNWGTATIDISFDFENIYRQYKSESKIDELFDSVTELLQKILDDQNSYEKNEKIHILINIIKNNQNKSCYADDGIIHSIYNFLVEVGCTLAGFPSLAPLITQLTSLFKQIINSYRDAKQKTEERIKNITNMDIKQTVYLDDGSIKQLEDKIGQQIDVSA